jgi:hypothetical protein
VRSSSLSQESGVVQLALRGTQHNYFTVSRARNLPSLSLILRAVWQQRSRTEFVLAYRKCLLIPDAL